LRRRPTSPNRVVAEDRPGLLLDVVEHLKAQQVLQRVLGSLAVWAQPFNLLQLRSSQPSPLLPPALHRGGVCAHGRWTGLCAHFPRWHLLQPDTHRLPPKLLLSVDTFRVVDMGTGGKISDGRMVMLRDSLSHLCGPSGYALSSPPGAPSVDANWAQNQHLGDTAMLRAHIMVREQVRWLPGFPKLLR